MVIALASSSGMSGAISDDETDPVTMLTTSTSASDSYFMESRDGLHVCAATGSHSFDISYSYDALGNRHRMVDGATTMDYNYQEDNRLMSISIGGSTTESFSYDANGNLKARIASGITRSFTYDYEDRLTKVTEGATVLGEYLYDGLGRRVKATENGMTTYTIYRDISPLYTKSGTTETDYIYANGLLIARLSGSTVDYFHSDALGSTRLVTDSNANTVFETHYRPFGQEYGTSGSDPSFKFTGQKKDATGLYYLHARQYDPDTGRFISADPVLGSLSSPQSLNRYLYVMNNPLSGRDPTGMDCSWDPFAWDECLGDFWDWASSGVSNAFKPDPARLTESWRDPLHPFTEGWEVVSGAVSGLASWVNNRPISRADFWWNRGPPNGNEETSAFIVRLSLCTPTIIVAVCGGPFTEVMMSSGGVDVYFGLTTPNIEWTFFGPVDVGLTAGRRDRRGFSTQWGPGTFSGPPNEVFTRDPRESGYATVWFNQGNILPGWSYEWYVDSCSWNSLWKLCFEG